MKLVITTVVALVALLYTGCATNLGNERHAQHGRDQIEITRVQVEARERMALDRAQAQANWALAMAQVAQASPETADAIAVALAVASVKGSSEETQGPVVTLQRMNNEALEWTKALVPTVGNVVTGLGVAAINADLAKRQSDNLRDVQINDANRDAAIVGSVADLGASAVSSTSTLGVAAVGSGGLDVTGDYYAVSDSAVIDQSSSADTDSSVNYSASDEAFLLTGTYNSSSNNTSGDTNTDSQNTSGDTNTDSQNTSGDTTTDSSDNSDNSVDNSGAP